MISIMLTQLYFNLFVIFKMSKTQLLLLLLTVAPYSKKQKMDYKEHLRWVSEVVTEWM